jgi:hypothetical protein
VQNCDGTVVWAVSRVPDLPSRLYELALARDGDPQFWLKMAGLEAVPTSADDFEALRRIYTHLSPEEARLEILAWQHWWGLREAGGIPLFPIWNPALARDTRDALVCNIGRFLPETTGGVPT